MILGSLKTAENRGNSTSRKLKGVTLENESTSRLEQVIDVSTELVSTDWNTDHWRSFGLDHQRSDKKHSLFLVDSSGHDNLENCLKRLDKGIAETKRIWSTQQKAGINKLGQESQLART